MSLVSAPEGRRVTSVGGDGASDGGSPGQRPPARQISLAEGERAQFRCVAPAGYPVWPLIWKLNGRATEGGFSRVTYFHLQLHSGAVHSAARSGERLNVQYRAEF